MAVFQRSKKLVEVSTQLGFLFNQVDRESLSRQTQGRCHPRGAAANDQGGFLDRNVDRIQGYVPADLGNCHADQLSRFLGGGLGVIGMDPGAVIADIGHLK